MLFIIKVAVARVYKQFYKALDCLENKMVSDEEREDDEDAAQGQTHGLSGCAHARNAVKARLGGLAPARPIS